MQSIIRAAPVDERSTGASRHDEIHEIALSERVFGSAQQLFLEPGELREADGKAGIIAECTQVAQVIRKALQFQRERS